MVSSTFWEITDKFVFSDQQKYFLSCSSLLWNILCIDIYLIFLSRSTPNYLIIFLTPSIKYTASEVTTMWINYYKMVLNSKKCRIPEVKEVYIITHLVYIFVLAKQKQDPQAKDINNVNGNKLFRKVLFVNNSHLCFHPLFVRSP